MAGKLAIVSPNGRRKLRPTVTTRTDRDVNLREFVVEAEGLDDIALSLRHEADIARYEAGRAPWSPKVA